jgi:hypothetical protein
MRRIVSVLLAAAAVLVPTAPSASAGPTYAVKVFADVPAPGHPIGVVVQNGRVVVSTSAGAFIHPNTQSERVFTFDMRGRPQHTALMDEGPISTMGLAGMAFDGRNRLYVLDMNSSITRYAPDGSARVWSSAPFPYAAGSYWACMWTDVDFDRRGNAYVPDSIGTSETRIWRITPGGAPSVWFSEKTPLSGGPFQAQIDARGKYLYFARVAKHELDLNHTSTISPDRIPNIYRCVDVSGRAFGLRSRHENTCAIWGYWNGLACPLFHPRCAGGFGVRHRRDDDNRRRRLAGDAVVSPHGRSPSGL